MRKPVFLLFLCSTALLSGTAFALSQASLERQIAPLIADLLPQAAVGVAVAETQSGRIIYTHNAAAAFNPASCAKLFSTAAALWALGSEYHYNTTVLYDKSQLSAGTLKGDLTIQFSGDPSMTLEKLKGLVSRVRQAGIRRISGNVRLDNTAFALPSHGPGWSQDDLPWAFAAPITSIILNQNAVGVMITPNPTLNQPAHLSVEEGALRTFVPLTHQVKTVTYDESMVACQIRVDADLDNHLSVQGCWPTSTQAQRLGVALRYPDALAQVALQRYFSQENIQLGGNIVFGPAAEKLAVLVSDESLPLSALVTTVLKDSNNVYAECLTKTLGRQLYHQGTFLAGSRAIKHILAERAAIDFKTAVLVDGSGQSRYDLVSPLQIVRLLQVIAHDPELAELFKSALPESGTDGTLTTRLNSPELIHHIHAKTGSFKGVATLSGYITTKTGTQLTFSILLNQVVGGSEKSHALQTKIAAVLYNAF